MRGARRLLGALLGRPQAVPGRADLHEPEECAPETLDMLVDRAIADGLVPSNPATHAQGDDGHGRSPTTSA